MASSSARNPDGFPVSQDFLETTHQPKPPLTSFVPPHHLLANIPPKLFRNGQLQPPVPIFPPIDDPKPDEFKALPSQVFRPPAGFKGPRNPYAPHDVPRIAPHLHQTPPKQPAERIKVELFRVESSDKELGDLSEDEGFFTKILRGPAIIPI